MKKEAVLFLSAIIFSTFFTNISFAGSHDDLFGELDEGVDQIQKVCGARGGKIINGVVACTVISSNKEVQKTKKEIEIIENSNSKMEIAAKIDSYENLNDGDQSVKGTCSTNIDGKLFLETVTVKKGIKSSSSQRDEVNRLCRLKLAEKIKGMNIKTEKEIKQEMAYNTYQGCIDDDSMKKQVTNEDLRKKTCFKMANQIVEDFLKEKCKKTNSNSDIVRCEDGTTYKKIDSSEKSENFHLSGAPGASKDISDIDRYINKKFPSSNKEQDISSHGATVEK